MLPKNILFSFIFLFSLTGCIASTVHASFEENFVVLADAIQPDGKIVAVGYFDTDFALARYNDDGSLDMSFGTNGIVVSNFIGDALYDGTINLNLLSHQLVAVAVQPDGKIVTVGRSYDNAREINFLTVMRYEANGKILDHNFGNESGLTTFQLDEPFSHPSLHINEGIITITMSDPYRFLRFNSDGHLIDHGTFISQVAGA